MSIDLGQPLVFIAFQTDSKANGGLQSFTEILRWSRGPRVVITQRESAFTSAWRELGCEVHVLQTPPPRALSGVRLALYRAQRVPAAVVANARISSIVRDLGARVVHCNDPGALWFGGVGARAAGARIVLNVRGTKEAGADYGLKWRIIRHLADEIVGLSAELASEIDRKILPLFPGVPVGRTSFIYSAVDPSKMSPVQSDERAALRTALGLSPTAFIVGHFGIFDPNKNQLGLIEHLGPRLLTEHPAMELVFVGDFDPLRHAYAVLCADASRQSRLGGRIRFVGYTPAPEDWYRSVDVVCVTSRHEGLARAMIESLACGTPVISFDVSSAREILVGHDCGRVVAQGDFDALVTDLLYLARNPEARRAMGARGAAVARELFDPERTVAQYVALYRRWGSSQTTKGALVRP